MRKWKVKLPKGKCFEMESDTPHEDLATRGYDRYALEEIFPVPPAWKEPPSFGETKRYDIPDEVKELTTDALAELALRLEIEAAVFQQMNTHEGRLAADDRLEQAAKLRQASDYYLKL